MSDNQGTYSEAATKLFSELSSKEVVESAERGVFPDALWAAVENAGFAAMLASEEHGGVAATPAEAVTLLRVAGQFTAPLPLVETMLARWLLSESKLKVGSGPLTLALGTTKQPWSAARRSGKTVLTGRQHAVPWAGRATAVVVLAQQQGKTVVALVDPKKLTIEAGHNIAGEPRDTVVAEGVEVAAAASLPELEPQTVFRMAALFTAALMTGALERILDMSVRYSTERVQFGRPLSRFQAIQQQLAVLAGAVAAARAITDAAASVVDRADGELMVAAARARLADAVDTGAAIAHQVHGAMGFVREYPLHASTRRLWAWRDEYGTAVEWRERLGRAFAGTPADALWPKLTAVGSRTR